MLKLFRFNIIIDMVRFKSYSCFILVPFIPSFFLSFYFFFCLLLDDLKIFHAFILWLLLAYLNPFKNVLVIAQGLKYVSSTCNGMLQIISYYCSCTVKILTCYISNFFLSYFVLFCNYFTMDCAINMQYITTNLL